MTDERQAERLYLDYAAATPVDERVLAAMEPYWRASFGNAGGKHAEGRAAREALEGARATVAKLLNVAPDEIIFTGSGTEANNLAIHGVLASASREEEAHAITSTIEHPSVRDVFRFFEERHGIDVSYLPVNASGLVEAQALREALRPQTALVSLMYVNNEIGSIEPLSSLAKELRDALPAEEAQALFHTDASQAPLFLDCSPSALGVDLMTLDGQKMYGPKGVGVLYRRRGVALEPLLSGGNQEQNLRPGTENIPLIVGFAKALELAIASRDERTKRVAALRDRFIEQLLSAVPDARINGPHGNTRIANNVSVSVPGLESEYLVALLDVRGIAAGTKSACMRDEDRESYVLAALGDGAERSGAVRFSLGEMTSESDIERATKAFVESVATARGSAAATAPTSERAQV